MADEELDRPKVAVGIEMKVNLGNYESAQASLHLSGLHADATVEEIDELLDAGKLAYSRMVERLRAQIAEARAHAWDGGN